jgi:hypothetical protein
MKRIIKFILSILVVILGVIFLPKWILMILLIIIYLIEVFEPKLDVSDTQCILWINNLKDGKRKFIIIAKNNDN